MIAARYPDRIVHVVGDAAYVRERLRDMDDRITWTSRLKVTSALHELPPPRTGRSGRPRTRGARLGTPAEVAHRPHRALHQRPPAGDTPPHSGAVIRPLRRDRLGGVIHEYVQVRNEQIGNVVIITRNPAGRPQHIVANYRPRTTLLHLSRLIGEHFVDTPYAEHFASSVLE